MSKKRTKEPEPHLEFGRRACPRSLALGRSDFPAKSHCWFYDAVRYLTSPMNKLVSAVKALDFPTIESLIRQPKWNAWSEPSGKNALHFLCGVEVNNSAEADISLRILKLLLKCGLDINSVHRIQEKNCDFFPATPLWYAYTRGRNEKLYKYLLKQGADPSHCWWAIAWYDDVAAAKLWQKHGAVIDINPTLDDLFLGSFQWKKMKFANWTLEQGANVNARGPGAMTALILAVKRKDEDAIRWLVENGADADIEDEKGTSARKIAETKGPRRLLDLLGFPNKLKTKK
jgi:hypothetical protein